MSCPQARSLIGSNISRSEATRRTQKARTDRESHRVPGIVLASVRRRHEPGAIPLKTEWLDLAFQKSERDSRCYRLFHLTDHGTHIEATLRAETES